MFGCQITTVIVRNRNIYFENTKFPIEGGGRLWFLTNYSGIIRWVSIFYYIVIVQESIKVRLFSK